MIVFTHRGLKLSQVVPVGRNFQLFMRAGIIIGIGILVDVRQAIRPKINGVRTGSKTTIVLLRILDLHRQGFPATSGAPVKETGPTFTNTPEFFFDMRDELVGDRIPVRSLTGRVYCITIIVIGCRMLYFYNQKSRKVRFIPAFIEVIGFLLLNDIITFHIKTSRIFGCEVLIRRSGPEPSKVGRKVPVENHQRIPGLGMVIKSFGQEDVCSQVHIPPPEF